MNNIMRTVWWWIGLLLLVSITANLNIWVAVLLAAAYGLLTSVAGYYAFPFLAPKNKDTRRY